MLLRTGPDRYGVTARWSAFSFHHHLAAHLLVHARNERIEIISLGESHVENGHCERAVLDTQSKKGYNRAVHVQGGDVSR